jgi:transcriptional antiterminator NusG
MERSYQNWIAVQTTTQHEHAVEAHLRARIIKFENKKIKDIFVPEETTLKVTLQGKKSTKTKVLPGYILVQVEPTEGKVGDAESYIIRGTPHVIGFVSTDVKKPVYMHRSEVKKLFERCDEAKIKIKNQLRKKFNEGEVVKVIIGPFVDFIGSVISSDSRTTRVELDVFNKKTITDIPSEYLVIHE